MLGRFGSHMNNRNAQTPSQSMATSGAIGISHGTHIPLAMLHSQRVEAAHLVEQCNSCGEAL